MTLNKEYNTIIRKSNSIRGMILVLVSFKVVKVCKKLDLKVWQLLVNTQ